MNIGSVMFKRENIIRSNLLTLGDPVGKALESEKSMTQEGDIINQSRKKIPIRFSVSPLKLITGKKAGGLGLQRALPMSWSQED